MTMPPLPELAAWVVAGLALGAVYLWLVGRTVAAIVSSGARKLAAGYFLLRLALAAAALWIAASQGGLPLLAMLLGFLVARSLAVRRARMTGDGS